MEVASSANRAPLVFLYEAFGTMLFVYSILLTSNPISISFSLFASIILFGSITGGHFNPAVTLGIYIREAKFKENLKWLGVHILGQLCGAFLAMGLAELTLFEGSLGTIPDANVAKLCPQHPANLEWPAVSVCDGQEDGVFNLDAQVLVNEAILTAVFVSVILMVKDMRTSPTADGMAGALAIVLTLLACIKTGGKLGGCFNPAVSVAVGTFSLTHVEDVNGALAHYIYAFILGPLLGGAAAGAFSLLHSKHFEPDTKGLEGNLAQKAQ